MNWKPIFQNIGKGYTSAIGKALLTLTLVAAGTAGVWLWRHQWSESQLLSIRQTSSHLCLALLAAWGWVRFCLAWKMKHGFNAKIDELDKQNGSLQHQLQEALKPKLPPAPADPAAGLEFDRLIGVWTDKTHLAYCPVCKGDGKISPMKYTIELYHCPVCLGQFSTQAHNPKQPERYNSGRPPPLPGIPDLSDPTRFH